ncbi:MAG: formylglycine-generating enzyme family protein [Verrucomicrobiota bacterium]
MIPETLEVPAGRSVRGGGMDDRFTNATELPRGEVVFEKPFRMSVYPITVADWLAYRSDENNEKDPALPMTGISWWDANDYCVWLSEKTGDLWRLPTENEWEYACRAGTETPFATGHDISPEQANYLYSEHGARVGPGQLRPVGSYPPNEFGLHDMHGNVSEWTSDLWSLSYDVEPLDGETRRVVRGGGWDYLPRLLRSSWRDSLPPETRRDDLGFRVLCEVLTISRLR